MSDCTHAYIHTFTHTHTHTHTHTAFQDGGVHLKSAIGGKYLTYMGDGEWQCEQKEQGPETRCVFLSHVTVACFSLTLVICGGIQSFVYRCMCGYASGKLSV